MRQLALILPLFDFVLCGLTVGILKCTLNLMH